MPDISVCNTYLQLGLIIYFSFTAPVEGWCCKLKYWANIIHHFIFLFFLYFFYFSSCRKDHINLLFFKTVLKSLKFGTQDFTDPGLLKILLTLTGLSLWFCLYKYFWYKFPCFFDQSYVKCCSFSQAQRRLTSWRLILFFVLFCFFIESCSPVFSFSGIISVNFTGSGLHWLRY